MEKDPWCLWFALCLNISKTGYHAVLADFFGRIRFFCLHSTRRHGTGMLVVIGKLSTLKSALPPTKQKMTILSDWIAPISKTLHHLQAHPAWISPSSPKRPSVEACLDGTPASSWTPSSRLKGCFPPACSRMKTNYNEGCKHAFWLVITLFVLLMSQYATLIWSMGMIPVSVSCLLLGNIIFQNGWHAVLAIFVLSR